MPPVEEVLAENAQLKGRIAELEAQIAWFRRQVFGGGKSEKADANQLEFLEGLLDRARKEQEAEKEKVAYERAKPERRRSRSELYGDLPVLEETVIEPEQVEADPCSYERVGEEETFEVKVDPPRFYRRRIVRPKYRRIGERGKAPVVAPAAPRPVEGVASAELLAHVVASKYLDHLPLHRQCAMFKRHGFRVERQSLTRWVEKVAAWLKPVYNHMRRELLEGDYLQVDETPIRYCDPDYGEKRTRTGFLCGATRPGAEVWYKWSGGRSHAAVSSHLKGFRGVLQADMYEAYPKLAKSGEGIELAACWAHARRRFFEAKDRHPRECGLVLELIGRLYAVEKEIREGDLAPEDARALRREKASNAHARIRRVLHILRHRSLPKSGLGEACDYALRHWDHLSTYLDHGRVRIDNNNMENAIRPTAVGKKNWLFVGHPQAGERAAILYSILISCQRLDVQPLEYLTALLKTDLSKATRDQLAELTPSGWAKSRRSI